MTAQDSKPLEAIREQWQRQVATVLGRQNAYVVVAFAISWHLNRDTGDAWPALTTLAKETGISERSVKRAVKWLEVSGHMQIVHGGGNVSNRYRPILLRGDSHVTGDSRVTTGVTKSTERGDSRGLRTSKEPLTNLLLDASHQGGTFDEEPVGESPKAKLFRKGRTLLVSLGVSEKQSGAVIGRWLKQKNDPEGILAALQYAADNAIIEPISYVTACLAKEFSNAKISLADRAKQLADQAREIERANGLGGEIVAFGGFQRG